MEVRVGPFRSAHHGEHRETARFTLPAGPTPLRGLSLAEPAGVTVEMAGTAVRVSVRVAAHLPLRQPCDRCLEPVALALSLSYREQWRLVGPRRDGDVDAGELDADDARMVRRTVSGDRVGLGDSLWQNVSLDLPSKVLCDPECRGLCPRCGANRNRTPCTCRERAAPGRLAALADWRPDAGR